MLSIYLYIIPIVNVVSKAICIDIDCVVVVTNTNPSETTTITKNIKEGNVVKAKSIHIYNS